MKLFGDEGAHRSIQHPDSEGEVEVEKRREQRRPVAGIFEFGKFQGGQ